MLRWSERLLNDSICEYYSIYFRATFVMILKLLMKHCKKQSTYLVYIYNNFIFLFILNFFTSFDIYLCV